MANHSLYRIYRPQTFSDVVGQEHIEQTLRNALANDRVSHAYLFCGPRGTGKTTTARLLAKALLCDKAPTANPDGTCENCLEIAEGVHPDVYELDAASRTGVDNVREEIIGRVAFSPTRGRYKVYIIDEVHMLSTAAFNALLKTLEEPPAHVVFVLCTTDPQKVPATIVSRCQRFDFHSLTTSQISDCLVGICESEGFKFEPQAIELIAKQAKGGMRDAITALEQVAVFGNGTVGYPAALNMFGDVESVQIAEVFDLVIARDAAGCFRWVESFASGGIDVAQVARSLTSYARNLYVAALGVGAEALPAMSQEARDKLEQQARMLGSADRAASMLMTLGDLAGELRASVDARLSLEIALTRMAHPEADLTLESLAARIDALEGGAGVAARPAAAVAAPAQADAQTPGGVPAGVAAAPAAADGSSATAAPAAAAQAQPAHHPQDGADVPPASEEEIIRRAVGLLKDPSSLRRIWDTAVRNLAKSHPAVPSLVGGAQPHPDLKHSRIVVELPFDAQFARDSLSRADVMQDMLLELQNLFGIRLGLDYVLGQPGNDGPVAAAATAAAQVGAQAGAPDAVPQPQPAQPAQPAVDAKPAPAPAPASSAVSEPAPQAVPEPAYEPVPVEAYEPSCEPAPEPTPEPPVAQGATPEMSDSPAFPQPADRQAAAAPAAAPSPASEPQAPRQAADVLEARAHDAGATAPSDAGDGLDAEARALFTDVFGDGVVFRGQDEPPFEDGIEP